MKKTWKFALFFAIIVILSFSVVLISSAAEVSSGTCGTELTWVLNDEGTLTISGTGKMTSYNQYSSFAPWYNYRDSVKKIVVEEGVTSIGASAFYKCAAEEVALPTTIKNIYASAFSYCEKLKSVEIPEGITSLPNSIFYNCTSLESVYIPPSVESAGYNLFGSSRTIIKGYTYSFAYFLANDLSLEFKTVGDIPYEVVASGNITETVTWCLDNRRLLTIAGTGAMSNYSYVKDQPWASYRAQIREIIIEDGITSIGDRAFEDCEELRRVINVPSTITYLGSKAFNGCKMLQSFEIPDGVTALNGYTFVDCTSMSYVVIPYSVTSIGNNEFPNTGLTLKGYSYSYAEETIAPAYKMNFVSIGVVPREILASGNVNDSITWSVDNYYTLTIEGEGNLPEYTSYNEVPWYEHRDKIKTLSLDERIPALCNYMFYGWSKLTEIKLPEHITHIPNYAFSNCSNLDKVTIPENVTSLGKGVFSGSSNLTEVKFHENITSIPDYTFENCKKLTSVKNIENITSLGEGAFISCSALTTFTIPEKVTSIGKSAFKSCSKLTSVNIPNGIEVIYEHTFNGCSALKFDLIPASVKRIEDYAFTNTDITGASFENLNNIEFIGKYAFAQSMLDSFTIPEKITAIADNAFEKCYQLTTVTIPSHVKTVGNNAFLNCSKLNVVNIEDGVESFGSNVFQGCNELESISFPDSVTSIGERAFYKCKKLTSVKLPENLEAIKESTFEECVLLNHVTIPSSVKTIEKRAFYWCSALESIVIPDSVKTIGEYSFYNCDGLKKAVIGNGIYEIKDVIFSGCDNLNDMQISYAVGYLNYKFFDNLPDDLVVKGYTGSVTEFRCNKDGVTFVSLGKSPDGFLVDYGTAGSTASWRLETNGVFKVEGTGKATGIKATTRGNVTNYYYGYPKKLIVEHGINYVAGNEEFFSSVTDVTLPYTVLMSGLSMLPEGTTVRGYKNSYAESFAKSKGFTFVSLGETPDEVVASGTIDNISWTLTTKGKLTLSGEGDLKDLGFFDDFPWNTYRKKIKELVVEEGVLKIPSDAFASYDYQFEKATFPCLTTHQINSNYFTDDAIVYCYQYSYAHDRADASNIKCEFIGVAPKYVVASGTAGENITWAYDNHRNLVFEGYGEMDSTYTPWSSYLDTTENVTIADGIENLDSNAFLGAKIKNIVIPNSVTHISNDVFRDCDYIEDMTIPYSLLSLNDYAFSDMTKPKVVRGYEGSYGETLAASWGAMFISLGEIPEKVEREFVVNETISYKVDNYGNLTFYGTGAMPDCKYDSVPWKSVLNAGVKRVVFEEGITRVGTYNLSGGRYIESVTLPQSLTEIGANAMRNLKITEIVIPENVEFIGYLAFRGNSNLKNVKMLGESIRIGEEAFADCETISTLQLPKTVKVWNNAFLNTEVKYIYYAGSESDFNTLVEGSEYLPEDATIFYQADLPEEVYVQNISVTRSVKGANVRLESQLRGGEAAFIAGYDADGTMVTLVRLIPKKTIYAIEGNIKTVKVIFWDGENTMNPINEVFVKTIN